MLAAARRDLLLERLERDGRLVAKDLALELNLSEDSIRRDLRDLAAEGLLTRVYGGALPASPATADYAARMGIAALSKARVGARAASLIEPGSIAIIDGGTTALALVRAIPLELNCTIVTHSPTVAAALLDHAAEVLILGGRLFKHSAVTSGAAAAEAASRVSADLCFLGVTGVHHQHGLTTGDADEAAMKRTLASRAAETYVLASEEKIGAASPFQVLPLTEATAIVDRKTDPNALHQLRQAGLPILEAR